MRKIERPAYLLDSVDNALRLQQMLRDVGALRLKDAARELDVSPSTAHRLFAMLVYRGFAVQDERRWYHPGPAMGAGPARQGWTKELTDRARPHMKSLSLVTGETVNLMIRVGTQVRFLWSAESSHPLRIGDRQGQVLPAERTAGGRALLAALPKHMLEKLYPLTAQQIGEELAAVRRVGLALNVEQTEDGVAAFGVAVHDNAATAIAALSVSVAMARYHAHSRGPLVAQLRSTVRDLEADLR